jgi:hypothetical protein
VLPLRGRIQLPKASHKKLLLWERGAVSQHFQYVLGQAQVVGAGRSGAWKQGFAHLGHELALGRAQRRAGGLTLGRRQAAGQHRGCPSQQRHVFKGKSPIHTKQVGKGIGSANYPPFHPSPRNRLKLAK